MEIKPIESSRPYLLSGIVLLLLGLLGLVIIHGEIPYLEYPLDYTLENEDIVGWVLGLSILSFYVHIKKRAEEKSPKQITITSKEEQGEIR